MRSTIRFLAAAGLAVAAVPAGADPGAGVPQDAYVGSHWNEAPHTGALLARSAAASTQTRLAVTADAFVGIHWSDDPSAQALSTVASPAATPGPRSSTCACPCLARAR